jgi:ATP-dependent Lhr-like helicase
MPYDLLSPEIRKYVHDKRWEVLRPIQAAAITRIMSTDEHYILASRTASGKTEAAFLPVLSKIDRQRAGVFVLYVSPLIALINDQFARVEELCTYLDMTVTKWHGEASVGGKNRLLKEPSGVVLITPESIEAMFVNRPYQVKLLFEQLQFVVIDEIHAFIGSDRGVQLKSLLSRLRAINKGRFRVIGLSATIGDYEEAKRFTGEPEKTKVLLDKTAKETEAFFRYFPKESEALPVPLLKDLYRETSENKVLLFPNSRGRAEEVAVRLLRISEKVGGHKNYFSHHSSVDKEVREYVEDFAKNNKRQNFLISCTSTLELGIDIGSVDEVVQIDATYSIASLIQRIGRSGRREGEKSYLYLYATDKWSLLQSLACWVLFQEGFIDPPEISIQPYDILAHQALSIVKSTSGISSVDMVSRLGRNHAFSQIASGEIEEITAHLLETGMLELVGRELIIGVDGEFLVNHRDFFSVFQTEEQFKVLHAGNSIGEVPFSAQVREGENILLAARVWKIRYVDEKAKKIEVERAVDGKKPVFSGGGGVIHSRIREKMMEILFSGNDYQELNDAAREALRELRCEFNCFSALSQEFDRPLWRSETSSVILFPFVGTKVARALVYLLRLSGLRFFADEGSGALEGDKVTYDAFLEAWSLLGNQFIDLDMSLAEMVTENPAVLGFSKWGQLLPAPYQVKLLKARYFDFDGARDFLTKTIWRINEDVNSGDFTENL